MSDESSSGKLDGEGAVGPAADEGASGSVEQPLFPDLVADPLHASGVLPNLMILMDEVELASLRAHYQEGRQPVIQEIHRELPGQWVEATPHDLEDWSVTAAPYLAVSEVIEELPASFLSLDVEGAPEEQADLVLDEVLDEKVSAMLPDETPAPGLGGSVDLEQWVAAIDSSLASAPGLAGQGLEADAGSKRETPQDLRFILFSAGEFRFAVILDHVSELGRVPTLTPLPNVPSWLHGLTNLRGEILAVVELAGFFNPGAQARRLNRMLVVKSAKLSLTTGLLVEQVLGIRKIPHSALQASTSSVEGAVATYLQGFFPFEDRMYSVLDMNLLLPALCVGSNESPS